MLTGDKVGPYTIVAQLGKGGMGEVYRAHDARLKRDVAIKVLPTSLAGDPERLARFEREAHLLAALKHPRIAHVYGLEVAESASASPQHALVMELVDGNDLSEQLAKGPIDVEDALSMALQIVDALAAAHAHGIVHRDLKPANIKIGPDATIKVLDFGLAKLVGPALSGTMSDVALGANSERPGVSGAVTSPAVTIHGVILGTASYMAPEQAKGHPVDKRADIWAFGCVLFEMLSGRRLFDGGSVSEVIAALIKDAPDWTALPEATPASVRRLLARCLEKDPRRRLHDIADARFDIEDALASKDSGAAPAAGATRDGRGRTRPREVAAWIAAAGFAVAALILAVRSWTGSAPDVALPSTVSLIHRNTRIAGAPQISPDGRRVTYVARNAEGLWQIWVRELDATEPRALAGTEEFNQFAIQPFWSPDSRHIGFFARGALRRVSASGGEVQQLGEAESAYGGAWSADGTIIYAPEDSLGLMRVAQEGGQPTPATTLPKDGVWAHLWPSFLPDGRRFLFTARAWNRLFGESRSGIFLSSLDSTEPVRLLPDVSSAVYAEPGYILFARDGILTAVPFDADTGRVTGDAFSLRERVSVNSESQRASFSVSRSNVLALRRALPVENVGQLQWVDRKGDLIAAIGGVKSYSERAVSPDGRHIAASIVDPKTGSSDIWILGNDGSERQLTVTREFENAPVWSPDGRQVAYLTTTADGAAAVNVSRLDGSDPTVLVEWREPGLLAPMSWSPDGRHLMLCKVAVPSRAPDLVVWSFETKKLKGFLETPAFECVAQFSPDGSLVSYVSDEGGPLASWIARFEKPEERHRIAVEGGIANWRRDGREALLLKTRTLELSALPLTIAPGGIVAGPPTLLLKRLDNLDVDASPDHSRILILSRPDPEQGAAEILLVTGWQAKLR